MGRVFFNTRENVHTLTAATYQCLASDSGKTFVLNSTSAMTVTLPADADISEGWNCRFVVKTANDNAYTIKCSDVTDSTGQMFIGAIGVTSTTAGFGHSVLAAANDSQMVLDGDLANGAGEPGSYIDLVKTEAGKFFASGCVISDDADTTGAEVFGNAS
jgi:hypothetical protein